MIAASLLGLALGGPAWAAEVSTTDTGHVQNAQFSPDGKWLAFEMNNLSNSVELWLTRVNGAVPGPPRQIKIPGTSGAFGAGGTFAGSPVWAGAPNAMVIFEGSNPGGTMRLYYASPESGAPNEFISVSQVKGNLSSPAISTTGQHFAFVSDATGHGDIYIWDMAEGEPKVMFISNESEHAPDFTDDGKGIVFSRKNDGSEDLFRWDGGGTTPPLKGGNGDQTRPIVVGDKVVYFSGERGDGTWDIAVVPLEGGKRTIIARQVKLPARSGPAVTPDGLSVAWVSSDNEKSDAIGFTNLDGTNLRTVPTGFWACGEPELIQADGRLLLAFTALPNAGADWRRLHILDVTGKL
jgi:Tol biopolymer transport system component